MDSTLAPMAVAPMAVHSHTIVFLHGRGDNAASFATSLQHSTDSRRRTLRAAFPSFRWVFPRAPLSECAALGGQKTSQWFDIWNVTDFSQRELLQAPCLKDSVARILRLLHEEAALLAGISQGAATTTHALLNLSLPAPSSTHADAGPRLGAYLGFSCRMPFPGRSPAETRAILGLGDDVPTSNEVLRNTPVLLEHCVDDPLVLVANGRVLRDTLVGFGAQVLWNEYQQGGHWFN
ncbi:phospholipase/Carboxylesterase [Hirsutella rhossiliensis]|uniref:Phospholipase/Carboxylesterase domain-containing protein n=1 Tax=Hirsutella rhossiliensis TaxID=111463 RepID=A0A9P8SGV2_9HYPO|nr:phospholipase/Carboxylesterase domain-containing protein [Hirsutella rhossiliensis]KAH0961489.1 phospholipase/Carboxylesterase domain-containing protein [Hirsutella rhossiliensis]